MTLPGAAVVSVCTSSRQAGAAVAGRRPEQQQADDAGGQREQAPHQRRLRWACRCAGDARGRAARSALCRHRAPCAARSRVCRPSAARVWPCRLDALGSTSVALPSAATGGAACAWPRHASPAAGGRRRRRLGEAAADARVVEVVGAVDVPADEPLARDEERVVAVRARVEEPRVGRVACRSTAAARSRSARRTRRRRPCRSRPRGRAARRC